MIISSRIFNAQVFSTTASFIRYSVISYLNEAERYATFGSLFENLVDDTAVSTYAQRLWDFFQGFFKTRGGDRGRSQLVNFRSGIKI